MTVNNLSHSSVSSSTESEEVVLSVERVSKKFCRDLKKSLVYGVRDIASEVLGGTGKDKQLRLGEFWALKDVSLQLRKGEALGLIGPNGSGKTTLLRTIAGLIKPDSGQISVKGRTAPLLAAGVGFNPILTGRENIYANMSILGLSKQEIDDRFDEVVEFAEIPYALDAPVQSYSSGMKARLGFACAIHVNPEILLLDEVLAVGDIRFRVKCYRKLAILRESGVSFILVSHSPNSMLAACERAAYLKKGRLMIVGSTNSILNKYEEELFDISKGRELENELIISHKDNENCSGLFITRILFVDLKGYKLKKIICGQPAELRIVCNVKFSLEDIDCFLIIQEQLGEGDTLLRLSSETDRVPLNLSPGIKQINIQLPYIGIKPGLYTMKIGIKPISSLKMFDVVEKFVFRIESSEKNTNQCLFFQPREWSVQ